MNKANQVEMEEAQNLYKDILGVIRDGSRLDRFITSSSDGTLFVTTENTTEHQIRIGCGFDTTAEEEEAWAFELIKQAKEELM